MALSFSMLRNSPRFTLGDGATLKMEDASEGRTKSSIIMCIARLESNIMTDRNLLKIFQGILSSQSFELLSEFSSECEWHSLEKEEKEVLSQLFLIHGESFISNPSKEGAKEKAKEAFISACRLTPNSAKAHFRLGTFLALSEDEADVYESISALEKSISLDGRFFDVHYALACALLRRGSKTQEESCFEKADAAFKVAYELLGSDLKNVIPADFYWHWGLSLFLMGRCSGEAYDFQQALDYYQEAYSQGCSRSEFLNDYANAYVEFSLLVDRNEFICEAALLYEEAASQGLPGVESSYDVAIRLFNAACCYVHLFERTLEHGYFIKAENFFHQALLIEPLEMIWHKMGQLYFLSARAFLRKEHIQKAIDCFHKSVELGSEHPVMLAYYSQSLLLLYEHEDRPELLRDATSIAQWAIVAENKTFTHSAEPYLAQALCCYEQGVYFDDKAYFDRALDIVQKALQEHSRGATLWYALGLVKIRMAEYERHEDNLREANVAMLLASRSLLCRYSHFWNDWGIALLTLADLTGDKQLAEDACMKFEVAIELSNFQEMDWIYNLGCALDLLGQILDSDELLERAFELFALVEFADPTIFAALLQQAIVLIHLGEKTSLEPPFIQADSLLRRYLTEENEDDHAWCELGTVSLHLAEFATMRGDEEVVSWYMKEADLSFYKALLLGNEEVYYHLACYHALLGDHPEAMNYLWKAEAAKTLPPIIDLLDDDRLFSLLATAPFGQFLRELIDSDESVDAFVDGLDSI